MLRDALVLGFQTAQLTLGANLAGLTQEESLTQPGTGGNCINWLVGHVLVSRAGLQQLLGMSEPPALSESESKPYQQGSGPLRDASAATDVQTIASKLASTSSAIVGRLQSMTEEDFGREMDPKMFPVPVERPTLGALLSIFSFHEAYHSGQVGLGRRLIGKAPGMPI